MLYVGNLCNNFDRRQWGGLVYNLTTHQHLKAMKGLFSNS